MSEPKVKVPNLIAAICGFTVTGFSLLTSAYPLSAAIAMVVSLNFSLAVVNMGLFFISAAAFDAKRQGSSS